MTSRFEWRRGLAVLVLSLSCMAGVPATVSAGDPENQSDRSARGGPSINSFSAVDQGSRIRFRVNWCDPSPGTQYKITWRMFKGQNIVHEKVSNITVGSECNITTYRFNDTFTNGTYRGNAEVRNKNSGAFARNQAEFFTISR